MLDKVKSLEGYFFLFLSVLLTSFSLSPFEGTFGFLGFFSLVPLLYFLRTRPIRKVFSISWVFFLLIFLSLFWIDPAAKIPRFQDPLVVVAMMLFFSLLPLGFAGVTTLGTFAWRRFQGVIGPLTFAAIWTSWEYGLTILPMGFPLSMALSQTQNIHLIQIADAVGIHGVSFLLILSNVTLASVFGVLLSREEDMKSAIRSALILSIPFLVGFATAFGYSVTKLHFAETSPCTSRIVLVQPNVSWREGDQAGYSQAASHSLFKQLKRMSEMFLPQRPDLLVWPELSLNRYVLQGDPLEAKVRSFVMVTSVPLLFGTLWYDHVKKRPTNAVASIGKSGTTYGIYQKMCLVPFFESFDYGVGEHIRPVRVGKRMRQAGALICFESLYPQLARMLAHQGANFLCLVSNDVWFGRSRWEELHACYMVFRALETGLFALHLNNGGPSWVISPTGEIKQRLPAHRRAVSYVDISTVPRWTLYQQLGDWFALLCSAWSFIWFPILLKRR